jgi:hypothetical protein
MLKRTITLLGLTITVSFLGLAVTIGGLLFTFGCGGANNNPIAPKSTSLVSRQSNSKPNPPTIYFPPPNSIFSTPSKLALFRLRATDPDGDRLKYRITLKQNGQVVMVFDQTQDPSGWKRDWRITSPTAEDYASGEFATLYADIPAGTYSCYAEAFDGKEWSNPSNPERSFTFVK